MTIHRTTARLAVLVLGVVAAPFVVAAKTAQAMPVLACSVKLANDSIPVRTSLVRVGAALSEVIGDSVSATLQQESMVAIVSLDQTAQAAPKSLQLTLNTSEGVPGDWNLSLRGTTGECTGKVKIIAAR